KRLGEGERALSDAVATERFPTTTALAMALDGTLGPTHSLVETARRVCREARVLHWPLIFPQVFEKGGFDVVLGNPRGSGSSCRSRSSSPIVRRRSPRRRTRRRASGRSPNSRRRPLARGSGRCTKSS